jgi:molybdate transport system permease protein
MIAGNIPGRTDTMPLAVYSSASSGDWSKTNLMVLLFTLISGSFLYMANRLSKRFV